MSEVKITEEQMLEMSKVSLMDAFADKEKRGDTSKTQYYHACEEMMVASKKDWTIDDIKDFLLSANKGCTMEEDGEYLIFRNWQKMEE